MGSWISLRRWGSRAWPAAMLVLLGTAGSFSLPQTAQAANPVSTTVTVSLPASATIGDALTVKATLSSNGVGVPSRLLVLLVDGKTLRTASVDAQGVALIPIRAGELSVARLTTVTVRFPGAPSLSPSVGSAVVDVHPARLTIRTIPAVDGIGITVGTVHVTTSSGGVAVFAIPKLGSWAISPDVGGLSMPAMRADFVRWGDNVYTAERHVTIVGNTDLQLGVHTAYRGSFRFVNAAGAVIDPSRIQSVTLTSTSGSELFLTQYAGVWLEAGTAVKRLDALAESPRTWRVLDVEMDGTNVVNRGQQRVDPRPDAVWTVELLLYNLHVEAHDALFGGSIAGTLELVYPDNHTSVVRLGGPHASADFLQLPRGNYTLRLSGAGLGAPTPVVLSQGQTAVIRVITYLDLGLFGAVTLGTIAGLLWFGRREQLVHAAHRIRLVVRAGGGETRGRAQAARLAVSRPIGHLWGWVSSVSRSARLRAAGEWASLRSDVVGARAAVAHDGRQLGRLFEVLGRNRSFGLDLWAPGRRGIAIDGPSVERTTGVPNQPISAGDTSVWPTRGIQPSGERAAVIEASLDTRIGGSATERPAPGRTSRASVATTKGKKAAGSRASGTSVVRTGASARIPKAPADSKTKSLSTSSRSDKVGASQSASRPPSPRSSSNAGSRVTPPRAAPTSRAATHRTGQRTSGKKLPGSVTGLSSVTSLSGVTRLSGSSLAPTARSRRAGENGSAGAPTRQVLPPAPTQQVPPATAPRPQNQEPQSGSPPRFAEILIQTFEHASGPEVPFKRSIRPMQSNTGTCPHCGRFVTPTAMYCRSCGELIRTPGR